MSAEAIFYVILVVVIVILVILIIIKVASTPPPKDRETGTTQIPIQHTRPPVPRKKDDK